jgi:hypothetical protein
VDNKSRGFADPPFVLDTVPAATVEHRLHRSGEVVVFDVAGRDPADLLERVDMTLEERFLRLRRVDPVDGLARVRKTEHEHVTPRLHAGQNHPDFTEVDLGFRARHVLLRDEHVRPPARGSVNLGRLART